MLLSLEPCLSFSIIFLMALCFPGILLLSGEEAGVALAATQGEVSVRALVEKDTVAVGEPFEFQIHVEGMDSQSGGAGPDMSGLTDFTVESQGGRSNSQSSITIINGKMTKVESKGYIYSFRLTPKKVGQLVIPAIPVPVDPKSSRAPRTEPITIRVTQPEASDDFHLEVRFAKTRLYVGEPVVVEVTYYFNRDVDSVSFNLPFLDMEQFTFIDPKTGPDPGKQVIQIPIGQGAVTAEKGRAPHKGRDYTTLVFRKAMVGREPGVFSIGESTVSSRALAGHVRQSGRSRSPFGSLFDDDFFQPGFRQVYKTYVARSEPVSLTVQALPQEGRPADFYGAVGRFGIEATASPTDVSVGDPITLTISISSSDWLENLEPPPLAKSPELEQSFKIPEEIAAGVIKDGAKVFTQTIRARNDQVSAIPPIRLSYFDPQKGQYMTASSKPIALKVKPTRIVTEADVEGAGRAGEKPLKSELEAWSEGIAHNYEGPDVLVDEGFDTTRLLRSPLWVALMALPLGVYLALFVTVRIRRSRMADPEGMRSRKALAVFRQKTRELAAGSRGSRPEEARSALDGLARLLDALRGYLGDRLRVDGAALTSADARLLLKERGVDEAAIRRLEGIFEICEEGRYGGGIMVEKPLSDLVEDALEVVQGLDRML